MRICDAEPADDAVIISLWERCGLTRPWNHPQADIDLARRTPTSTILVGWRDRIVATAMVGFDGHRAWMYYLAVEPDLQRGGFGRMIMGAAETWARAQGSPKLQLMVRNTNAAAAGFYEALGYSREDVAVFSTRFDRDTGP
jgi:ribosomal protein S18 acetylase RimI-like enzyme